MATDDEAPARTKESRKKCCVVLLGAILIIVTLVFVIFLVFTAKGNRLIEVCTTSSCNDTVTALRSSMNFSRDPCDDFYGYVCDSWEKNHVPESATWISTQYSEIEKANKEKIEKILESIDVEDDNVSRTIKHTKILFDSCLDTNSMNYEDLDPLFKLLDKLSLPKNPRIFASKFNASIALRELVNIKRVLGSGLFFEISKLQDPRNSSKKILTLHAPPMKNGGNFLTKNSDLTRRSIFDAPKLESIYENVDLVDYKKFKLDYIFNVTEIVMAEKIEDIKTSRENHQLAFKFSENAFLEKIALEIFELEDKLKKIQNLHTDNLHELVNCREKKFEINSGTKIDSFMTLDQLQNVTDRYVESLGFKPVLFWKLFVEELLQGRRIEEFLILNVEYLKELSLIFAKDLTGLTERFIWWKVVDNFTPFLTNQLRETHEKFIKNIYGRNLTNTRSQTCAEDVAQLLGPAVSRLLVDNGINNDEQVDKIEKIFTNVKKSMSETIKRTKSIDGKRKAKAIEKLDKVKLTIGYPKSLLDNEKLDSHYKWLDLGYSFFDNVMQILENRVVSEFFDDREALEDELVISPTELNIHYLYQSNEIVIPTAILQPPFFSLGTEALDYGAVGSVLSHELARAIDYYGGMFDENGNINERWTPQTFSNYTETTACLTKQYVDKLKIFKFSGFNLDKTLYQNYGDNFGFFQAYRAFHLGRNTTVEHRIIDEFFNMADNKLFTISYAHTWCQSPSKGFAPARVRVNTVLQNFGNFGTVWGCLDGARMNPKEKCKVVD